MSFWVNENIDQGWYPSDTKDNTYIFYLSTGYVNCDREEELEFDDEDLNGLDEMELDKFLEAEFNVWKCNYLDTGYSEV